MHAWGGWHCQWKQRKLDVQVCLFFLSFFLLLLKKLGVQKPLESPSGCFNGTHVDLKVIHPPVHLCLRTVKPSRAIKNILCSDPPQPASTPSRPSEESLLHPGCWVPASRHCSLSHASWHLPRKKTHSRLWAWPLSSRAVSSLYLACPLPWVSTPARWWG